MSNTDSAKALAQSYDIQYLKGVGPRRAELFAKMGIHTLQDFFFHLPRRYEDRSHFKPINKLSEGESTVVKGKISFVEVTETRNRLKIVRALLDDATGTLELIWFNQPWMKDKLARIKSDIIVFGTVSISNWALSISNPEFEEVDDSEDSITFNRIVPIYPLTEGLFQKQVRQIMWTIINNYQNLITDLLPSDFRRKYKLGPLDKSIRQIHFPDKMEFIEIARRRLVFDEFLGLQLNLAHRRSKQSLDEGIAFKIDDDLLERFQSHLPYPLTNAQTRVISEIWNDMKRPMPMSRLLQGDVGSGKTVVAASAILAAISAGYQTAIMAPTEILAEQHHRVMKQFLSMFGIKPDLLTGKLKAVQKREALERISNGKASVVVGTHALIQEHVDFARLGLVIIDEQHRFGVMQRGALIQKGVGNPDVLVMTATPIPRTLTMTLYGDLDVSVIDELPKGRITIKTRWMRAEDRGAIYEGIRKIVSQGEQVYLVCPLVEESEKMQAKAAVKMAEKLQNEIFPDISVGLIHGQLKSAEKDEVMEQFRSGEIKILVATTVIEVGVDVPNATVMVIEDADRFGLSQLHQLRGRVGRGDKQSHCILVSEGKSEDSIKRLSVMCQTSNGFVIAEEDLKIRGPGEVFGTKQSGMPDFQVADLKLDLKLLEEARSAAFEILREDPELKSPANEPFRLLMKRYNERVVAASVG